MGIQSSFEDENWKTWNTKKETYEIKKPEIETDRDRIYHALCNNGGSTCKEISLEWGCTPNEISGRFTELHNQGFIIADGKKYLPNSKGRMYPHTIWRVKL